MRDDVGPNAMNRDSEAHLDAAFLGPLGENAELLESLIVDAIRDHAYWRRNFHPDDDPAIGAAAPLDPQYQAFVARTRQVLRKLSAELKHSVPWFSPRYIGHMASDLLIPGVVARVMALLYNPNNVSGDASGVMVARELDVGMQLARMVGYPGESTPWGHLTSGGTIANIESLWNHRTARLYPLALADALTSLGWSIDTAPLGDLREADPWRLANLCVDEVLALRREVFTAARELDGGPTRLAGAVEDARLATVGQRAFLERWKLADPVVVVPHSAHYSWSRAMKVLGFGRAQLVRVHTDEHMRLDARSLAAALDDLRDRRVPVISVVGVLGTTEFGTLDPIHALVDERDQRRGTQGFGVHVDAAWGGYLAALFRRRDGSLVPREELRERFRYFPSEPVYESVAALARTDSVTIDPHKLGFIPYPAGAFVTRDREIAGLLVENAAYAFGDSTSEIDFSQLGKFILEGSKPGAAAASVYAAHEVLPLHEEGFGQLIARTIRACEWLDDALRVLADELSDVARLVVPFEPDSNIVCLAVNPDGNRDPEVMNTFVRELFDQMRFRIREPSQSHEFIGSFTSVTRDRFGPGQAESVFERLGLDVELFGGEDANLFLLRHTLMNPWLMQGEPTPLEGYVTFLGDAVRRLVAAR